MAKKPSKPEVDTDLDEQLPQAEVTEVPASDFHEQPEPPTREVVDAIVATKTAPRVTVDSIMAKIKSVKYANDELLCICIIEMQNGFKTTGVSAPASPANFDLEVGRRYAYENAFKNLWQLEGYLLCEDLYRAKG